VKSFTTPEFWRQYQALPAALRRLALKNYRLWKDKPRHAGLHFMVVRAGPLHTGVFNLADFAILVGMLILVVFVGALPLFTCKQRAGAREDACPRVSGAGQLRPVPRAGELSGQDARLTRRRDACATTAASQA
jgi:hypothetical protein